MNLLKTGSIIKEQRKQLGLTQQQLAEKLNVSEKTISKWETGKGLPDSSIMLDLCSELKISANELLSGKLLNSDNYKNSAEKNIIELKNKYETSTKNLLMMEWVIGYTVSITFFILIFVASFINMPDYARILLIVVGFVQFFVGMFFGIKIEKDAGFYECQECKHKYIPSYNAVLWAMHIGRTRYMKCPKCGKRSWQKKIIDNN